MHSMHWGWLCSLPGMHIPSGVPVSWCHLHLKRLLHCPMQEEGHCPSLQGCFNSSAKLLLAFGCGVWGVSVMVNRVYIFHRSPFPRILISLLSYSALLHASCLEVFLGFVPILPFPHTLLQAANKQHAAK